LWGRNNNRRKNKKDSSRKGSLTQAAKCQVGQEKAQEERASTIARLVRGKRKKAKGKSAVLPIWRKNQKNQIKRRSLLSRQEKGGELKRLQKNQRRLKKKREIQLGKETAYPIGG